MSIDWKNLQPLPLNRQKNNDREKLAKSSFEKRAANHKGRAHWYAWQKRQELKQAAIAAKKTKEIKDAKRRIKLEKARAYWRGEINEHPK